MMVGTSKKKKLKLVVSQAGHNELSLLSTDDNSSLSSFTHPLIEFPIASSNNEMLLCECKKGGIALWNPTTDDVKTLPKSTVPRPPSVESEHHRCYGFGFDPKSEQLDFKVVRFLSLVYEDFSCDMDNFQVELYSLKTNSWKDIAIPPKFGNILSGVSIHLNGFCYWQRDKVIIRFDFANDNFSSPNIPLPETIDDHDVQYSNFILAEFEGSLAVLVFSLANVLGADEKPFEFEIWVWSDDDESWTRRRVSQIIVPDGSAGVGRPIGLFNNEKLYLEDFLGEIVLFDCGNGRLTKTGLRFDQEDSFGTSSMFRYVESSVEETKLALGRSREFQSKLTPVVRKHNNNNNNNNNNNSNKRRHLMDHKYEGTRYFSQLSTIRDEDDDKNVFFNFPSLGARFYPVASCNSALLLCIVGMKSMREAALWNPTTDHVKKLPDVVSPSPSCTISCYGLGFDPKPASASQDHDYKVIRFINKCERWFHTLQVELYSLKTDSCKDITSLYPLYTSPKPHTVHVDGLSYWVFSGTAHFIISFDFAKEKFSSAPHIPLPPPYQKMPPPYPILPPPYRGKLGPAYKAKPGLLLAQFHGSLAALVYTHFPIVGERGKSFLLEVWVWESDESSWARVSTIHVPDVDIEEPLGLIGNDQLYLKGYNSEVWLYDYAKGGELKNLGLIATSRSIGEKISPYLESSFPLNGKKMIRASHKIINH